ncbi:MAG: SCO family protein [Deltaproteobacteria bacterium]|nr:SCO family protein [Deltaproteobacteria bacterium]
MRTALFILLMISGAAIAADQELPPIGIELKIGSQLSLDLPFKDESGKEVWLRDFLDGKTPVLLTLVYYGCPSLCTTVLNNFTAVLKKNSWSAGKEFRIVSVSIDPRETPELAAAKKEAYLKNYGRPEGAEGWHFLTGNETSIKKLADEAGFRYFFDEKSGEFVHVGGIFVLTPDGKVNQVLQGSRYDAKELKEALLMAAKGRLNLVDRFKLMLNWT